MKTRMVVTDLTRMHGGRVCIAGYDGQRRAIRPVLPPPGIPESSLYLQDKPIIYPFALIELDLLQPISQPPHTEDQFYDIQSTRFVREVHGREEVLDWSVFDSVSAIFEQPVHDDFGFYVMDCQGPRSLGTVRPSQITAAIYSPGEESAWDYRLIFQDNDGRNFKLKITDLTWQYYCNSLRGPERDPARIAAELTEKLKSCQLYLRIGLARGWKMFPERCYIQITGVYTFPDYLEGKTFADFAPARARSRV
ncbi:MAG: hypothetical protein JXA78_14850 [Anaerolineales bacterium]|nr:hypothetical protein [Anaerolineales bacterium]